MFNPIARNALVVVAAGGAVAIFEMYDMKPFSLPKKLPSGLPPFKPPAFSVSDGNTTYTTADVFSVGLIMHIFDQQSVQLSKFVYIYAL
jgi:hypothetical protein